MHISMIENIPAFPTAEDHKVASDIPWTAGMTLRDWFAGHAVAGMAARVNLVWDNPKDCDVYGDVSRAAYLVADAMLVARSNK